MLSYPGLCIGTHATLSSSDVIGMLKRSHHIMSHIQQLLGAFLKLKTVVFDGEQEKESIIHVRVG